jgi:hypothetical protein
MTTPRDPEALLTAYLAGGMEVLSDRVVDAVLDEAHRTRQRALRRQWSTRSMVRAALSTAAVVALFLVGGALLSQRDKVDVSAPSPTAQASTGPSQPAVVTATPTPTAEVLSLDLTWTEVDIDAGPGQVAWLNDHFVLVDSSGAIRTSTDGLSWGVLQPGDPDPGYADLLKEWSSLVTWEDQIVGWWNPQEGRETAGKPPITARDVLRIVQPPAQPTVTTPFEGRIQSIAVGPAGIVAETNFHPADSPDEETTVDAVWFSPDGIEWTAIQGGLRDVVGVSDGFIARDGIDEEQFTLPGGCGFMWHSSDGLAWRNLGHPDAEPESWDPRVLPWMGGALVTDGLGVFGFWTSQGYSELPMGADFPAPAEEADAYFAMVGTGPLGLVSIRRDPVPSNPTPIESLVTRDGVAWKIQPIPAAMATETDHRRPIIAVGDRSVVYLAWSGYWGEGEGYIPHLWVGSVVP